ncbi:MAG: hypothetical protein NPIRA02_19710 [Nitrospirales bacterium]|nr:MAG: hypothetical protein NPIRA02_19710 [Nitrospirales bacterium]
MHITSNTLPRTYCKTIIEIDVGVCYQSDLQTVIHTLIEAASEHPDVLRDPAPKTWLLSFGDSSWNMRLLVWLNSPKNRMQVISDVNCAIVEKFRSCGVEIPFSQRDLHLKTFPMSWAADAQR